MVSLALFFSLLSLVFKYCGPLIEAFRGDDLLFRHSRNLLSGIHVFKYCGPRLENCRGDGHGGFFLRVIFDLSLLSSCFSLLGVDKGGESPIIVRNIQGMGKGNNREKQYMPWLSGL